MNKKVSVIIAAYNAKETIARAVNSALAENGISQVIIVDDASTDETGKIAAACDDGTNRLEILTQPKNAGPSAARNRALERCRSEWITILDADDFFLPGRIAGLLAYADQADMIADDMWQVPEENPNGPRRALLGEGTELPCAVTLEDFVMSNITRSGQERKELGFIKPLIRNEILKRNNIHYKENMRLGEDYELYTRTLASGAKLLLVPAQGYVSVVRAGSLSGRHTPEDLRHLRDCNKTLLSDFPDLPQSAKAALKRHYHDTNCRLQWRLLIEAVKKRDIIATAKTFMHPWPVPLYLLEKLAEQFKIRILRHPA